ncbi:MAG: DeoR/GlpR transcriptional regulator [Spirochaetes bacterium]|nr:MAG: DeoR/GlpR transcriptional regulator [Spirochaetota bacterium]
MFQEGALIPADRRKRIQEIVQQKGVVKVAELSKMFGVSELTIRRDLDILERKDILERTHGGAVYNQRMRIEPLYEQKSRIHRKEKEAIGALTTQIIEDGDTLLINSGSTTREVMKNLKTRKVRIITSNMSALFDISESNVELIFIGGYYRKQSNSLVGSLASLSLQQIYGSKSIIGVDGISIKYGLTTPIMEEAEVARQMIERTPGPVIIVADHSKIGVVSNFITAPLDKVDILVTDEKIDEGYKNDLEKEGIKVLVAKLDI